MLLNSGAALKVTGAVPNVSRAEVRLGAAFTKMRCVAIWPSIASAQSRPNGGNPLHLRIASHKPD
jgi:hypothetical protein